jgi:hypothetical protein
MMPSLKEHLPGVFLALSMLSSLAGCGGESASNGSGGAAAGMSSVGSGGSSVGGAAGAGGGSPGGGGPSLGGGGGIVGCGSVVNNVALITPVTSASAPPTPAGGTIVSGTYVLSSLTFYLNGATCTPPSLKTSAVFNLYAASATSGSIEEDTNQSTDISTIKDSRATIKYTVADTTLVLHYDCNGALSAFSRNGQSPLSFTATASEILAFGPNGSCGVSVSVFTRR